MKLIMKTSDFVRAKIKSGKGAQNNSRGSYPYKMQRYHLYVDHIVALIIT